MGRRRTGPREGVASLGFRLAPEHRDFLRRRTAPFLDNVGLDRPLSSLLQEAYLQGIKDAMQVLQEEPYDA